MLLSFVDFNSIKVRLELVTSDGASVSSLQFQFHKGAIRTLLAAGINPTLANFNSIKVRLEHLEGDLLQANLEISIP